MESYRQKELIQRFRFGRDIIQNILLPLVYPRDVATTNRGLPIPPIIKLCTALRFYASGSYQVIIKDIFYNYSIKVEDKFSILLHLVLTEDMWGFSAHQPDIHLPNNK